MAKLPSERMYYKENIIEEMEKIKGSKVSKEQIENMLSVLEICDDCGAAWKYCCCGYGTPIETKED